MKNEKYLAIFSSIILISTLLIETKAEIKIAIDLTEALSSPMSAPDLF